MDPSAASQNKVRWLSNYVLWERVLPQVIQRLSLLPPRILARSPPGLHATSAAPMPPRAHLWAAVLASSTPAPCIHVRTAFIPATMGSSFILLPLLWMLSWMPNIKTHLHTVAISLSLSLLSLYPPLLDSLLFFPLPPLLLRLFDRAVRGAKWRGLFHLAYSCACVSQSKQKIRHVEGKGELTASRVSCISCQRLQKRKKGKQQL